MANVSTLPGTLNVTVKRGDELAQLIDFSVDLTGYTFEAEVVSAITGASVAELTVSAVDLEDGQVNLALSEADSSGIAPGSYLWRLVWTAPGTVRRTALEGIFEVVR
jgi:hypothetical protein